MKLTFFLQSSLIYTILFGVVVSIPKWYKSADGNRYLIEDQYWYNWMEALNACTRRDLQLIAIDTPEKSMSLILLLSEVLGTTRSLWIGATDELNTERDTNRKFYWSATGAEMTFSLWSPKNPNNAHSREHCVLIWTESAYYKWNDNDCSSKYGFICEEKTFPKNCLERIKGTVAKIQKDIPYVILKSDIPLIKNPSQRKLSQTIKCSGTGSLSEPGCFHSSPELVN